MQRPFVLGEAEEFSHSHFGLRSVAWVSTKPGRIREKGPAHADAFWKFGALLSCLLMVTDEAPRFPIVALGASAGGLDALSRFFRAMSAAAASPGMVFIVIPHLPPDQESDMAALLQRDTELPVAPLTEPVRLEPDHVYVLQPGRTMRAVGDRLESPPQQDETTRYPVDEIFRSIAERHGERAVAVVLSGTGRGGARGVGVVHEAGGLAIAQAPDDAEFDEMPRRAVETGVVDAVLATADMPELLLRNARRLAERAGESAPPDAERDDIAPAAPETRAEATVEAPSGPNERARDPMRRILALLRRKAEIDFRQYKPGTLERRIDRRATLHRRGSRADYADLLRDDPEELSALADDLLITVTSFFRDPEAWRALRERAIRPLLDARREDEPIRAWVAGCATGEEAYSLAIALFEEIRAKGLDSEVAIFATDASESALRRAREGVYPAAAISELTPEQRRRWFEIDGDVARVRSDLRGAIVFAPHDLLRDPPFSRADIVICRNVLIYLRAEVQQRLIGLFHFALRDEGRLFLGTAEVIGESSDLFGALDAKNRLFRKLGPSRRDIVDFPSVRSSSPPDRLSRPQGLAQPRRLGAQSLVDRALRALAARHAPPSVVIDGALNVVWYHGDADRYLHQAGEPTQNLLALARDGLAPQIRRLAEAQAESRAAEQGRASFERGGERASLLIEVAPLSNGEPDGLRIVSFLEESPRPAPDAPSDEPSREQALEEDARALREELAHAMQTSREVEQEHRAYTEEIVSMNEELRAANEELETSKEELQSLNEELNTVNAQLRSKLSELQERTADLDNLLRSTEIPTLFLDGALRIRWFSAGLDAFFGVRGSDAGRSIGELRRYFADGSFEQVCERAIGRLETHESQVELEDGRSFLRRVAPYRADRDRIDGVVVTFRDVTDIQKARVFAENIVESVASPLLVLDAGLTIVSANPAFLETFGVTAGQTEGRLIYDLGDGQWNIPELRRLLGEVLPSDERFDGYEVRHVFETVGEKIILASGRQLDHMQLILLVIEDVTERRRAETHQELLMAELAHRVKNALAVVQGLAAMSLEQSASLEEFGSAFEGRLAAYARAHDQVLSRDWRPGDLKSVLQVSIESHAFDPDRIDAKGPRVSVSTQEALALGLALHELETNAAKYGALSTKSGRVALRWTVGDDRRVRLQWRETGGPETKAPEREGFGTTLLRQLVTYDLGGAVKISYPPEGVVAVIDWPLAEDAPLK